MTIINGGGVTTPKGFTASGLYCGIRKNPSKKDLALVFSEKTASAAAVYTTNRVQAAPVKLTREHLAIDGTARAMLVNSGNANACAPHDMEYARRECAVLSKALGIEEREIIINSTGVIGQTLPVERIEQAIPELAAALSREGGADAAAAIMTTDLLPKNTAVSVEIGGKTVTIGAIAKGSGMIHPNMATMIALITTDCDIAPEPLRVALSEAVRRSYNRVSVDGDTSTNDMAAIMAGGAACNERIETASGHDFEVFLEALTRVCLILAKLIAKDGEGATKLVVCRVSGASCESAAEKLAKSVVSSSLTKAAMFGADANWGRVLCAMGYSGAGFEPERVDIAFESAEGLVKVCERGMGLDFDETLAKRVLGASEITIICDIEGGTAAAEAYGCDLSYDYVKINGDYRT